MSDDLSSVYALCEPGDPPVIRYVGKSNHPYKRYLEHLDESRKHPSTSYKNRWIASLKRQGVTPSFCVLEMHPTEAEAFAAEAWWVEHLRSTGHRLTNVSGGGRGFTSEMGALGGRAMAHRLRTDREFAKAFSETGRHFGAIGGHGLVAARAADEKLNQRMREVVSNAGKAGMATLQARIAEDKDFREKVRASQRAAGANAMAQRVRCDDCVFVASHVEMGKHHKKSGHRGKTQVA